MQLEGLGVKGGTAFGWGGRKGGWKSEIIQLGVCQRTNRFGPYQMDSPSSGFTGINYASMVKRQKKKSSEKVNSRHQRVSDSNS